MVVQKAKNFRYIFACPHLNLNFAKRRFSKIKPAQYSQLEAVDVDLNMRGARQRKLLGKLSTSKHQDLPARHFIGDTFAGANLMPRRTDTYVRQLKLSNTGLIRQGNIERTDAIMKAVQVEIALQDVKASCFGLNRYDPNTF